MSGRDISDSFGDLAFFCGISLNVSEVGSWAEKGATLLTFSRLPGGEALDLFTQFVLTVGEEFFDGEIDAAQIRDRAAALLRNSSGRPPKVTLAESEERRPIASLINLRSDTLTAAGMFSEIRDTVVDARLAANGLPAPLHASERLRSPEPVSPNPNRV